MGRCADQFEASFDRFIQTLPGARIIPRDNHTKLADYSLGGGGMLAELKCLEASSGERVQNMVNNWYENGRALAYGKVPIQAIIDGSSERNRLSKEALARVGRRLRQDLEDADKQIRSTKDKLNLPDALGIAVLANIGDPILSLDLAMYAMHSVLRQEIGKPISCPHIAWCLYIPIDETSDGRISPRVGKLGSISRVADATQGVQEIDEAFQHEFMRAWSKFCGASFLGTKQYKGVS